MTDGGQSDGMRQGRGLGFNLCVVPSLQRLGDFYFWGAGWRERAEQSGEAD